jgi:hypothetical protein
LYGAKKMNMISTGAFLTEMDASKNQPSVAEKFAAVWEKKNAKAARAGGVSLMALSLAACGSSSTTTTTSSSTTTTTTTTAADTIALTAGVDTVTGGAGDTTINALTNGHLEAADSIVGGAGNDTLVVRDYDTSAGTFTMSGVETLNINFATSGKTLDLEDVTGLTSLIVDAGVATNTVANAEAAHALTLANIASGEVTTINIDFEDAQFDGTNTYSLTLDDMDDDIALSLDTYGTSVEAIETLTINTGSNANTGTISFTDEGANAETVTITGAAAAKFSGLTSGTVNASGATGAITLTMSAEETSITGGSGNDVILMGTTLTYEDVIDGGDGTDTLGIGTTAAGAVLSSAATGNVKNVSNVETLRMTGTVANDGTAMTIDMSKVAGLLNVDFDAPENDGTDNNIDISNLLDGATITLGDTAANNFDLDLQFATNTSTNNLTIVFEDANVDALTSGAFLDTATLDTGTTSGGATITTISGFNANSIIAKGSEALTITNALSTSTNSFDASAMTAAVDVTASTTSTELTGGSAGDTLTGGSGADVIVGGAGVDTIVGAAAADTITSGSGADNIHITAGLTMDTILDFTSGTSGDVIKFDEQNHDGANEIVSGSTLVFVNLASGAAVDGSTPTTAKVQAVSGQETIGAGITHVALSGTTAANVAAAVDLLERGASHQMTVHADASDADDGFLLLWSDGTDGYMSVVHVSSQGAATDTTFQATALNGVNVAKLSGMSSISDTTFVDGNFAFI